MSFCFGHVDDGGVLRLALHDLHVGLIGLVDIDLATSQQTQIAISPFAPAKSVPLR